ncbi:GGDEF domain [Candidatus Nanopelagicaceae bacterium]
MQPLRWVGLALLALYLALHEFIGNPWIEFLGYNLVAVAVVVTVIAAPHISDPLAKPFTAGAIVVWATGSIVASSSTIFAISAAIESIANLLYLLFYPITVISFPRLLIASRKLSILELIDASIVGLGLGTLGSAIFLKPLMTHFGGNLSETFFAVMFPISDLVLLAVVVASIATQGISKRGVTLLTGTLIYALTDIIFLWQQTNNQYFLGSMVDAGWLIGLVVIAESFWQQGIDEHKTNGLSPVLVSISVSLSATLLALIALQPTYFPHFVLVPAIATLLLAFTRMAIALTHARSIGEERILARTDELTGLPNRRRLVSEIDTFIDKKGSLLLLDLDGFKPINDLHGHETGDKVLQQVAMRFERALPAGALLARLGGDEFGVLYEGGQESAVEVALALKATLSYPFHINNQEIRLGVSVGVAENKGERDLLVRADNAMYKAKREGLGVYQL